MKRKEKEEKKKEKESRKKQKEVQKLELYILQISKGLIISL
jgi:hypothetical protein